MDFLYFTRLEGDEYQERRLAVLPSQIVMVEEAVVQGRVLTRLYTHCTSPFLVQESLEDVLQAVQAEREAE